MKRLAFFIACSICLHTFGQQPLVIRTKGTELMIPEGIAVDGALGTIYVSSINQRKIIVMDNEGNHRDFIPSGHDKFLEGLGMKVDQQRRLLWALSHRSEGKQHTSQVHAFHIPSGVTYQYHVLQDTVPHLFNDLVIDKAGKIFLTDTYYSAVYSIEPEKNKLELVVRSPKLDFPNGIAAGSNGMLYIATYRNGLVMLDPSTKELRPLQGFKDSAMAYALDGLVWWDNSLIGVYNEAKEQSGNAVIQYTLNKEGTAITGERIIDRGHPLFYEPTTAATARNYLYVLANSHLAAYDANKLSVKGVEDKLTPVTVLRYDLK